MQDCWVFDFNGSVIRGVDRHQGDTDDFIKDVSACVGGCRGVWVSRLLWSDVILILLCVCVCDRFDRHMGGRIGVSAAEIIWQA